MAEDLKLIRPGEIRVRIAPSPTGHFHIGLARTALFNYLFAQRYQGIFILRIEDTDQERSKKEYEEEIKRGLKWLGIDWQESYRQSERKEIYKKYLKKLLNEKEIYHCFCSPEELKAHRDYQMSIGQPPQYSGKCRSLTPTEVEKNINDGKPYVFRFKTEQKDISFKDMLRGKITQNTDTFSDMVIAKNMETPLYNLACVIDDAEMKISHVIRGEDHISNTPKQLLLGQALGIKPPQYLHLPLILGQDRAKLSKRHGAVSLLSYREEGYLAEAVINFLAFLGWHPRKEREIFSINSLIQEFSIEGIQSSGAVFNPEKLDWLNSFYVRQKPLDKLTELCLPYLIGHGLIRPDFETAQYPPAYGAKLPSQRFRIGESKEEIALSTLQKIISLYQERLKKLSEIVQLTDFFFKKPDYQKELLRWKDMDDRGVKDSLDDSKKALSRLKDKNWNENNIAKVLMEQTEKTKSHQGDRGYLLWPLRAALTGKKASAGPFEIAAVLGKDKTLERLKQARKKL